jgi:hypothetical protein
MTRREYALPPVTREACGSYRGTSAHVARGEMPCPSCLAAEAQWKRDWRRRTGRTFSRGPR